MVVHAALITVGAMMAFLAWNAWDWEMDSFRTSLWRLLGIGVTFIASIFLVIWQTLEALA